MAQRRLFSFAALFVFTALLSLIGLSLSLPSITASRLIVDEEVADKIFAVDPLVLPFYFDSEKVSTAEFQSVIDFHNGQQTWFRIIPMRCVEKLVVNGNIAALPMNRDLCNQSRGFLINLQSLLKPGRNEVTITLSKKNSAFGIDFHPSLMGDGEKGFSFYFSITFLLSVLALLCLSLLYSQFGAAHSLTISLIPLLYLWHAFNIGYTEVSHDILPHFEYISYVFKYWSLPNPYHGFENHQPPLYYYLIAGIYWLLRTLGGIAPPLGAVIFSLILYLVYLVYALRLARYVVLDTVCLWVTSLVITLWPVGIMIAVRINNDLLIYAILIYGLYWLVRWYDSRSSLDLFRVFAACAVGLATKQTILPLLITTAGVLAFEMFLRRFSIKDLSHRSFILAAFLLLIGFVVSVGRTLYCSLKTDGTLSMYMPGIGPGHSLYIGNEFHHFIYFDVWAFLSESFYQGAEPESSRALLWNSLLKTMISGEFQLAYDPIARTLSALLLPLICFCIASFFSKLIRGNPQARILQFFIIASLATLAAFRYRMPAGCNQDVRYIFPITACIAILSGLYLSKLKLKWPLMAWCGLLISLTFVSITAYFYFMQHLQG